MFSYKSIFMFKKSGFSLIEAVIVMAILGTLSLGMVHLINHQAQEVSHLEKRLEIISKENLLNLLLQDPKTCENSLAGKTVTPSPLTGLTLYDANTPPGVFLASGATYYKIKINDIVLQMGTPLVPDNYNRGKIIVYPESSGTQFRGLKPIVVDLAILLNTTNQIVSCFAYSPFRALPSVNLKNFVGFYFKKLSSVNEGIDVCCDPGDILISGHWSSYVGEANAWYRRTSADQCMFFREGNSLGENGDLEIFCGRTP